MAEAKNILNTTRDNELLQSFVRINVDDNDEPFDEKELQSKLPKIEPQDVEKDEKGKPPQSPEVSKQLSQELKKKGKRRKKRSGPRHEELYCDKDRAAAVNMGSKDIKQSLKLKRKQDRSKALQIPEEAEPGTFLALGNYEMCRGNLHIALDFISKALELNPGEKNSLVARSKCYILLGQPENALKDAEMALTIDKSFMKAIYQKAEALYYLGDFEHSLMYFHRGLHIRPDHEAFKLGVHKAQKAIENAIGAAFPGLNTASKLPTINGNSSKDSTTRNASALLTSKDTRSSTNTPQTDHRTTHNNSTSTAVGVKVLKSGKKSRLLRELAPDKDYFDNLINNPNIKCKFKEDDSNILNCVKETVDYLNSRQEFWRQQLPSHLK